MQSVRILQLSRFFIFSLVSILLCFFLEVSALAAGENYRLTRLEWKIFRDEVLIVYDLEGAPGENYVVSAILLRESDKDFRFNPIFLTGKIGKGKFAGTDNEVHWAYKRDYPEPPVGDDYYIELRVEKPGGFPWLIAAGGAAIAGIAVVLTINKKSSGAESTTDQLPYPPPRP